MTPHGQSDLTLEEEIDEYLREDNTLSIHASENFVDLEGDISYFDKLSEILNVDPFSLPP